MSYAKGRRFEYYVMDKLKRAGFYVMRSAGSHGVFDLLAVKSGVVLGIQCKKGKYIPKAEKQKMIETAMTYGIIPMVAYKENNRVEIKALRLEDLR